MCLLPYWGQSSKTCWGEHWRYVWYYSTTTGTEGGSTAGHFLCRSALYSNNPSPPGSAWSFLNLRSTVASDCKSNVKAKREKERKPEADDEQEPERKHQEMERMDLSLSCSFNSPGSFPLCHSRYAGTRSFFYANVDFMQGCRYFSTK